MKTIKYYIPFIIALIITIMLFSSCVATKKQKAEFLSKYCERKDSISYLKKDSIIYRDSIILIPQIINTPIYLENPCKLLCDSLGNLKPFNQSTSKGGLKSTVKTVGNVLVVECETDSLKARISWLEKYIVVNKFSHTENRIEKPCELKHQTKFDGFTWYWFIITSSILGLWILIKIFKSYLKIQVPLLGKFLK
jgi:hypothetical protein